MIPIFIPSMDRAAQLLLLLRSLDKNAKGLFFPYIMYRYTNKEFSKGYSLVKKIYPNVSWQEEEDCRKHLYEFYERNKIIGLFSDDCVFYRKTDLSEREIIKILSDEKIWSFQFRLGLNIDVRDYVVNQKAILPEHLLKYDKYILWNYREIDRLETWGFESSFDGCLFRTANVIWLANNGSFNKICLYETMITNNGRRDLPYALNKPFMTAPLQSCVFAQQINVTHNYGHRTNNKFNMDKKYLNDKLLMGTEIDLESLSLDIRSTHDEIPFTFKDLNV